MTSAVIHNFTPGAIIHGFAYGAFGRDSYDCRRVEAAGPDWIVTRNTRSEVELCAGDRLNSLTLAEAGDRSYCSAHCTGPINTEE